MASYLSVIVQLANVGPLAYSALRWYLSSRGRPLRASHVIYPLLAVGCAASLLLALFWDETAKVWGVYYRLKRYFKGFTVSVSAKVELIKLGSKGHF